MFFHIHLEGARYCVFARAHTYQHVNEYAKQNANQLSGKSARLPFTAAIEQAGTASTKRL